MKGKQRRREKGEKERRMVKGGGRGRNQHQKVFYPKLYSAQEQDDEAVITLSLSMLTDCKDDINLELMNP